MTANATLRRPGGFTLVELLIVLAIIGLLVGMFLVAAHRTHVAASRMTDL
jgi:prepilin-type N-terminal cleavage/methylation domain-containing protein